jgi:hypothetical protein
MIMTVADLFLLVLAIQFPLPLSISPAEEYILFSFYRGSENA